LKACIHQPAFFPYPGFFNKLTLADVFVLLDNTQYDQRFINRNKISTSVGWTWLSVPINKKHKFLPNKEVEINNEVDWRTQHFKKIFHSYSNAEYFHLYKNYFKNLYEKEWKFLFKLNLDTIKKTLEFLKIKIKVIKESELNVRGESTQRLINICKKIGADTYISGQGGKEYMDMSLFEKNNLKVEFQDYFPQAYPQCKSKSFIPNLSIIDLLVNVGPKSLDLIKKSSMSA